MATTTTPLSLAVFSIDFRVQRVFAWESVIAEDLY